MWKTLVKTYLEISKYEKNIKYCNSDFEKQFFSDRKRPLETKFTMMAQDMNLIPRQAKETLNQDEEMWRDSYEKMAGTGSLFP